MFNTAAKSVALRNIFLVLFLASTFILVVLIINEPLVGNVLSSINASLNGDNPPTTPSPEVPNDTGFTIVIGSVITSVTSLIGFIVTTLITWRKEKREAALAEVQRKRLEVELEKSRMELAGLKKSGKKKEVKSRKKEAGKKKR